MAWVQPVAGPVPMACCYATDAVDGCVFAPPPDGKAGRLPAFRTRLERYTDMDRMSLRKSSRVCCANGWMVEVGVRSVAANDHRWVDDDLGQMMIWRHLRL